MSYVWPSLCSKTMCGYWTGSNPGPNPLTRMPRTQGVAEPLARKRVLELELRALRKLGGNRCDRARASPEANIANFEKLVMDAE